MLFGIGSLPCHVFVDVIHFHFHDQAVGVCVDQLALLPISGFHLVVEEVVHQNLAFL